MKFLYVANNAADASKGAANADLSLLDSLRRRGHDVTEIWEVSAPRSIRHGNLHQLFEAPRKCEREVVRQLVLSQYDVVIVNQPLGWRAARAVRRRNLATLFLARNHGWEPRVFVEQRPYMGLSSRNWFRRIASCILRPFLHRQNSLLLRWVDGLIVTSQDDREFVVATSKFPAENVLGLPPGLPVEFTELPAPRLTLDRCRRLLYVGQFAPFKGPTVVAATMKRVLELRPNASATWVCAADDHPQVMALLPETVRHRVVMRDWMSRRELLKVYDAHGIYLFPSLYEGFAQTFLEAMARGMAVLASRIDGMAQAIQNGKNGFLFERGRPVEMAQSAIALIDGEVDLAMLGREARATAVEYTWTRSAEKLEGFISSLRRVQRCR